MEASFRRQHLEPLAQSLLRHPLDYILADHLRQRVLCVLCDSIAIDASLDVEAVSEVVDYLSNDMVVHVIDEEQDLFPLLRRRADPEDDIESVLGRLSGEHAHDETLAREIITGLRDALASPGDTLSARLILSLKQFAHGQRQHLALENATVMPLAKVRLTGKDLKELSGRMAARRGVLLDELYKS